MLNEIILAAIVTGICAIIASASKGLCTENLKSFMKTIPPDNKGLKKDVYEKLKFHTLFDQITFWKTSLSETMLSCNSIKKKHIYMIIDILIKNVEIECKRLVELSSEKIDIEEFKTYCINLIVNIIENTCKECKKHGVPENLTHSTYSQYKRLIHLNKSIFDSVCINNLYANNEERMVAIFNVIVGSLRVIFNSLKDDVSEIENKS